MELAVFSRLEAKIEEMLARLKALGEENDELRKRLADKDAEVAELGELLKTQDAERNEVRLRIESLVQKLESL
ncbi:MAG: cell division protein ZapB [Thermodesulfobacteriota bacterium]